MTAEQQTVEAMYRAVLEAPDCDTARLVYADALDEAGDHDRAEFVRVQCEREREPLHHTHPTAVCDCDRRCCVLHRRERDLLARHRDGWLRVKCPECGGEGVKTVPTRGNPLFNTMTVECKTCESTGDATRLTELTVPENTHDPVYRYEVTFRRGLLDRIEGARLEELITWDRVGTAEDLSDRHDEWRPTPLLLSWLTHHPSVTCAVPSDREPFSQYPDSWRWFVELPGSFPGPDILPQWIYEAVVYGQNWRTRDEAVTALGHAVVSVARRHLDRE